MSTSPILSQVAAIAANINKNSVVEFVCTSNQTTFSTTYDVGELLVFLNGILLDNGVDYAASNGTSVVLVNGAAADDVLTVQRGQLDIQAVSQPVATTADIASTATALAIALG